VVARGDGRVLRLHLTLDAAEVDSARRATGVIGRAPPFCFDAEEAAG
jgi:hypothetical protein